MRQLALTSELAAGAVVADRDLEFFLKKHNMQKGQRQPNGS
jgi:hypothetical protein